MESLIVGGVYPTQHNGELEVINYISATKVLIKFKNTGSERYTTTSDIRKGYVKDKELPCVYGVGYMGTGKYKTKIENRHTNNYAKWRSMIQRCYNTGYDNPTYDECIVCKEWLNFQTFSDWYFDTYPEGSGFQLDKDVLCGGKGEVYSPETCCWLPANLNSLFTQRGNDRGDEPLGVFLNKNGTFVAQMARGDGIGSHSLGTYKCRFTAFSVYKREKEKFVKQQAVEYKEQLTSEVIEAFNAYQVFDDSKWKAHLHLDTSEIAG